VALVMTYDLDEAARRTGIGAPDRRRLIDLGIVCPDAAPREVGPVELKGVSGAMNLHAASLPA
jgi:hypothetical protein